MPNVDFLPHIKVNLDTAAGRSNLERYARENVADGFEGIMIKDLEAFYECKRTTSWMKWKPTVTVDLEVIDVEEGTGKNKGRLGALVCESSDGVIRVNVGSGYSDEQRGDYTFSKVVGKIATVRYNARIKERSGETESLFLPRFIELREDKDIAESSKSIK
jgi:DNA ligase-1